MHKYAGHLIILILLIFVKPNSAFSVSAPLFLYINLFFEDIFLKQEFYFILVFLLVCFYTVDYTLAYKFITKKEI